MIAPSRPYPVCVSCNCLPTLRDPARARLQEPAPQCGAADLATGPCAITCWRISAIESRDKDMARRCGNFQARVEHLITPSSNLQHTAQSTICLVQLSRTLAVPAVL